MKHPSGAKWYFEEPFYLLVSKFTEIIVANEVTKSGKARRKRNDSEATNLRNAVKLILRTLWNDMYTIPRKDSSWDLHRPYYSSLEYKNSTDYKDITNYREVDRVTDVLIKLGYIIITDEHVFDFVDKSKNRKRLHKPSKELEKILRELNYKGEVQIPAIHLFPNQERASNIELRRDKKVIKKHFNEKGSIDWRYEWEMEAINKHLFKHWADLLLKDNEWDALAKRLVNEPLDLSKRTLTRIFSNGSYENTGRLYGGWWQTIPNNVPPEHPEFIPYRRRITIDGRNTDELDYSALGPNIFYKLCNKDIGNEDPYSRVFKDGKHRDLVKKGLNALIMANTSLARYCPQDKDLRELLSKANEELGWAKIETDGEIHASWRDLRKLILKAHPDIADQFGRGIGNVIQLEDSNLIIKVMVRMAQQHITLLSVHDSLIANWDVVESGELLKEMEQAYYERFGSYIKIKGDPPMHGKPVDSIIDYGGYASPEQFLDYIDKTGEYKIWVQRQRLWKANWVTAISRQADSRFGMVGQLKDIYEKESKKAERQKRKEKNL